MSRLCAVTTVVLAGTSVALAGPVTIDVVASSAPNAYGSPSWSAYASNALNSLEYGLGNIGDRNTDPTAYEVAGSHVAPGDFMVTSFNSWRGVADPGSPFDGERGNRMHFGLHAYGDGVTKFSLADVSFEISSSDPYNALGYSGDFVGLDYNGTTRYGVDWGPDGVKGGGDDTYYFSGNGTTLVDEIVYVGVGNAFWPQPADGQTEQEAIDAAIAWVNSVPNFQITGTYWIGGDSGSDVVSIIPLPTPGLLAGVGLFGLAVCRGPRRSGR
jgi:hypothetical protein